MEKSNIKDALGNAIEVGKTYVYTFNRNGINTILVGVAANITNKGMITLNVTSIKRSSYMDYPTDVEEFEKKISVKPFMLVEVK